jgi:hypothetical protein
VASTSELRYTKSGHFSLRCSLYRCPQATCQVKFAQDIGNVAIDYSLIGDQCFGD